jgi:threonine/homoserine/homoserine lactone efflux protein
MPVPLDVLLTFLPVSILINVVPGADMALIMRQVFLGGTALAQRTILGNMTGIVVHATALAVGLSALLVASAEAYTVVKLAGAAYLVYLGAVSLLGAWRSRHDPAVIQADGSATATSGRRVPTMRAAYLQGLISTVLNPKPAILFLTLMPQFVDESRAVLPQIAVLAGLHIGLGLIWLTLYAHMVHRLHRTLTRADVKRWLEGATGVVLIALGLRVAVEPR